MARRRPISWALPFPGLPLPDAPDGAVAERPLVPRAFQSLAELVACHRSPRRWDALYRLLWRISREGRAALEQESLDDIRAVTDMAAQVRRDEHKMRAFVRFVPVPDGVSYTSCCLVRARPSDRAARLRHSLPTGLRRWIGRF